MKSDTLWGICTTTNAPVEELLRFAAHHLEAGAHRIWVYLDAPDTHSHDALKAHPKCRVIACDDAYWQKSFGRRPNKHQVRQTWNATRAYSRAADVDWLLHVDVDEFLVSEQRVATHLGTLAKDCLTVRVRPMEALATADSTVDPSAFKAFIPPGPQRQEIVNQLYSRYGASLKGGFLSHVAGKLFMRTGLSDVRFRIHNVFQGETMNPGSTEIGAMQIAHLHTANFSAWRARLDYRLEKGAYRAELSAKQSAKTGAPTLRDVLERLAAKPDDTGLREFFEEVTLDSPDLRARLAKHGFLKEHNLDLEAKRRAVFPA